MATLLSPPLTPYQPETTPPRLLFSAAGARLKRGHSLWISALLGASVHWPLGGLPELMDGQGQQPGALCQVLSLLH